MTRLRGPAVLVKDTDEVQLLLEGLRLLEYPFGDPNSLDLHNQALVERLRTRLERALREDTEERSALRDLHRATIRLLQADPSVRSLRLRVQAHLADRFDPALFDTVLADLYASDRE